MILIGLILNRDTQVFGKVIDEPTVINDDISGSAEHHRIQLLATTIPVGVFKSNLVRSSQIQQL